MHLIIILYVVAGRPQTAPDPRQAPSETKGVEGWYRNSEMEKMSDERTAYIPPVQLEDLNDFKEVASEAAVIVYNPEYYQGPVMDDEPRIRRLTLSAVGVLRNGIPLTFRYMIDDVRDLERWATEILRDLERIGNVVRGSIESTRPIGELLAAWP